MFKNNHPCRKAICAVATASVALWAIQPQVSAASIANGSFEADAWPGAQYDLETSGVTGWTALDPSGTALYPWGVNDSYAGNTPYGSQFVVLGSYGTDAGTSIQQTVGGLSSGNSYELSFAISSEGYSGGGFVGNSNVRVAMLSGSSTPSADYAAPLSVSTYWDTWATFSYVFVATAASATFAFEDLAGTLTGYDIGIDNVSIADVSVPDAGSLAGLLTAVFAGMAGFSRRLARRTV